MSEQQYSEYSSFRKLNVIEKVLFYTFPFFSTIGFKYTGFNQGFLKAIYFVLIPIFFLYIGKNWLLKCSFFSYFGIMRKIFFITFFSIFLSYFFWNQNLLLGYRAIAPYLSIIFYFFLVTSRIEPKEIEKFLWIYAVLYILLWLYGLSQAPTMIYGDEDEAYLDESRGFFRINLPGRGFLVIAMFMALNKYVQSRFKLKFLLLGIFFFIFIVLQLTRQIILWSFIIGFYYLLKNNKRVWFYVTLIGLVFVFVGNNIKIPRNSIVGQMLELTQDQISDQKKGEEDIRLQEYGFFFTKYSKNIVTDIFGNGMPHFDSKYGKYYYMSIMEGKDFYFSDVGYAQMFAVTGYIGLLLYFFLFLKSFFRRTNAQYFFAKLFMVYQLFANIAASWYTQDAVILCVAVYLLTISNYEAQDNRDGQINISE